MLESKLQKKPLEEDNKAMARLMKDVFTIPGVVTSVTFYFLTSKLYGKGRPSILSSRSRYCRMRKQ